MPKLPAPTHHPAAAALLGLFFAVTLVAPAAPLNKLLFVLIGAWLLKDMLFAPPNTVPLVAAPFVVLAIFSYGYVLSWSNRVDAALALQFFTAVLVLFLIHFVRRHRIDLDRLAESSALVLLAFTALFWTTTLWPELPLATSVKGLIEDVGLGAVAERDFGGAPTLSLHLGTVPFLFVAFCLRFFQSYRWRDGLLLLLIAVGIVLSASRGLIAISVLFLLAVLVGRVPLVVRIVALLVAAALVYAATEFYLGNTLVLSAEENSNAVKIGHFESYFADLTLASVLAGRGLASYYYSSGSGAFIAHTEITPLDMARYLGVILTALLYGVILLPTTRLARYGGANRIWVIAFLLYLLLSATNPVMFNSYGMLVVLWYWWKLTRDGAAFAAPRPARA